MRPHKDIRILIAEDDFLVSEMIRGLLEESGYQVVGEAENGREAITLNQTLQPDVILMDLEMPEMGGLAAATHITANQPTPIVVLTAYETPDLVHEASQAGVGAYLVKPPNSQEIERAITIALARFKDLQQLHHLNQRLQSYNEELNAFAHTVAHDLQSQLSLITGFSDLLLSRDLELPPEVVQECVHSISQNAYKMSSIIDELLLLASVRQQEVKLKPLNMKVIVHEALQRLRYTQAEFDGEITTPSNWPTVLGYGPWVEEVWFNYVSNGLKYGGSPPEVTLGASPVEAGYVRFWVRDNGRGLSEAEQSRLFTPFTQLEQARAKGHGLGLSIVWRIIDKLKGKVGVESSPGSGSTFWFTLPAVPEE
ncbi:MAG: hybrid sensor histidine kinase/response regulator [Chloroflexota bacterium]